VIAQGLIAAVLQPPAPPEGRRCARAQGCTALSRTAHPLTRQDKTGISMVAVAAQAGYPAQTLHRPRGLLIAQAWPLAVTWLSLLPGHDLCIGTTPV
jgi:hypothetical protein